MTNAPNYQNKFRILVNVFIAFISVSAYLYKIYAPLRNLYFSVIPTRIDPLSSTDYWTKHYHNQTENGHRWIYGDATRKQSLGSWGNSYNWRCFDEAVRRWRSCLGMLLIQRLNSDLTSEKPASEASKIHKLNILEYND